MTRARHGRAAVLLICVSLAGAAGCATTSTGTLEGTRWKLTAASLEALGASGFAISASFAAGRISGHSAVNQYAGPYLLGPGDTFSAGPLASTRMAGPEAAMRAEDAYLERLARAKGYRLAADRLTLLDAGGRALLVFEAASP